MRLPNGMMLVEVLHGINLSIKTGEMVAIMGASGSGKSTLMGLLGGFDTISSGSYELNGVNIGELNEKKLNELRNTNIGIVFQNFHLFSEKTALENVMMPLYYSRKNTNKDARRKAIEMLEKVNLKNDINNTPKVMSGGECQRIAIARALVNNPTILLADEPTGNLDSKNSQEIMELLLHIHNELKTTIVIITHDPKVGKLCERILFMRDGEIVNSNYNIS